MKKNNFFAFTLSEILIVLSVIAIITAILLPAARNAMPNEKVMRFKKAHNALYSAIRELVNSDKYYLDGDLGVRTDGSPAGPYYFCNALSDILTNNKVVCTDITDESAYSSGAMWDSEERKEELMSQLDSFCQFITRFYDINTGAFTFSTISTITLADGTLFYPSNSAAKNPLTNATVYLDHLGFDARGMYMCIDIDGIPEGSTSSSDCVNECPFGYFIRADGKIFNGTRANEWLNKSIQEKD